MEDVLNNINSTIDKYHDLESLQEYISSNAKTLTEYALQHQQDDSKFINNYCRKQIFVNDHFEIILIIWNPDAKTCIHDHSDNGCIMLCLDGSITEDRYSTSLELISTSTLKKNQIKYIHNRQGYHQISSQEKSYSLHIYSPPNYKCSAKV